MFGRNLVLVMTLSLFACIDIGLGSNKKGSEESSEPEEDDTGEASFRLEGAGCGLDPITGVTLCLAVNACPEFIFDPELWPGCGYRIGPVGFDIQCACEELLCPIGTPLACEQIPALLEQQTQMSVCNMRLEGRCVSPGGAQVDALPGCDKPCAQQCGGEFGCLEQCGCTY